VLKSTKRILWARSNGTLLGSDGRNPTGTQTNWAGGRGDDLEDEHDGAEPHKGFTLWGCVGRLAYAK